MVDAPPLYVANRRASSSSSALVPLSKQKRTLDMGGNELNTNITTKKIKLEYPHLVTTLSGPVKEALNRFRETSEIELDRLRKEGFDLPTSVHKLVDKMRSHNTMHPSFTKKEIETVMELSGFNEEGARRALVLKEEISKLKKEGFNHPEAIDELSRRMKRLSGSKRRSSPLSLSGFMMMDSKRLRMDSSMRSRKRILDEEDGNAKKKMKTYEFVSSESDEGDTSLEAGSSDDTPFPFSFAVPFDEVDVHEEVDGFSVDNLDDEDEDDESIPSASEDSEDGEGGEDGDDDDERDGIGGAAFPGKDEEVWHFGNPLLKPLSSTKKRRDSFSSPSSTRQHNHRSIS